MRPGQRQWVAAERARRRQVTFPSGRRDAPIFHLDARAEDRGNRVWRNATTPGWFETMGIPLRSGRDFNDHDRIGSPLVAIVNEAFARRYLAGIGLYGIVAHAVSARRTEIGLRMALGALPTSIVRLVFRRLGVLIVMGLALGLAGSWWAVRFVAPLLFQVETRDPLTFSGTTAVLVAVAVLAAWVPARRAARLDPATVLREG